MNKYLIFLLSFLVIFSVGFALSFQENREVRKIIVFQTALNEQVKNELITHVGVIKLKKS